LERSCFRRAFSGAVRARWLKNHARPSALRSFAEAPSRGLPAFRCPARRSKPDRHVVEGFFLPLVHHVGVQVELPSNFRHRILLADRRQRDLALTRAVLHSCAFFMSVASLFRSKPHLAPGPNFWGHFSPMAGTDSPRRCRQLGLVQDLSVRVASRERKRRKVSRSRMLTARTSRSR